MGTDYKSRTQKKNEDRALQRLGEQLVALPFAQLETMGLPDELLSAIELAHKIKSHGARRKCAILTPSPGTSFEDQVFLFFFVPFVLLDKKRFPAVIGFFCTVHQGCRRRRRGRKNLNLPGFELEDPAAEAV